MLIKFRQLIYQSKTVLLTLYYDKTDNIKL